LFGSGGVAPTELPQTVLMSFVLEWERVVHWARLCDALIGEPAFVLGQEVVETHGHDAFAKGSISMVMGA